MKTPRITIVRNAEGTIAISMAAKTANRLSDLMKEQEAGIIPILHNLGDMSPQSVHEVIEDFAALACGMQNLSNVPAPTPGTITAEVIAERQAALSADYRKQAVAKIEAALRHFRQAMYVGTQEQKDAAYDAVMAVAKGILNYGR